MTNSEAPSELAQDPNDEPPSDAEPSSEWIAGDVSVQLAPELTAPDGDALSRWIARVKNEVSPEAGELTLRLVGNDEIRRLNREFRQKDSATDVLSFPGEETPEGAYLGDVVVSLPVAGRQADSRGHELATELRLLALHGMLHCLGYDHEADDGEMETFEVELRERFLGVASAGEGEER